MPNAIVNTDGSNNPITLSVAEERGHHIETQISINGIVFTTREGNFQDLPIGTNASVANGTISVVTTSQKTSPAANSKVVFTLKGAKEPHVDSDDRQFGDAPIVSHFMTYDLF
jgi:hypothetical protein